MSGALVAAPAAHLAFASLHVLLGHFGSALLFRLRFGRHPLVLYRADTSTPHATATRKVALASAAWAAGLVASGYWPRFRESALGRPLLDLPDSLGWTIAAMGLGLMLVGQAAMGEAFRVGQHEGDAPSALRTRGMHAWSRNPIYVGSFGALCGMTLWYPNALLVLSLSTIGYGIHRLVLAEEPFLASRFGEAYEAYRRRTPRYLGWPR
jgi:protein-S-isoprenylcysteine O-methyltransferase Ste14